MVLILMIILMLLKQFYCQNNSSVHFASTVANDLYKEAIRTENRCHGKTSTDQIAHVLKNIINTFIANTQDLEALRKLLLDLDNRITQYQQNNPVRHDVDFDSCTM